MKFWLCEKCNDVKAYHECNMVHEHKFCLPCSIIEKKPIIRVTKRSTKRMNEMFQNSYKKFNIKGNDLRIKMLEFCNLPIWRRHFDKNGYPTMNLRFYTEKECCTGLAYPDDQKFTISYTESHTLGAVYAVMIHELAHLVDPSDEAHGIIWRELYIKAAKQAFGLPSKDLPLDNIELTDKIGKILDTII